MYGFAMDFNPHVFVGRRLLSVSFAENLITLEFDGGLTVTVLNAVPYRSAPDSEYCVDSPPVSSSSLPSLVGRAVEAASMDPPRELMLELEGGGLINLVDDSESYESLVIRVDDREIIV
jgi:hypothetical protein